MPGFLLGWQPNTAAVSAAVSYVFVTLPQQQSDMYADGNYERSVLLFSLGASNSEVMTMRLSSVLKSLVLPAALFGMTIGAQATIYTFQASLDGPSENPVNASTGVGIANVIIDDVANTIAITAAFSGLVSPSTVAHIHCCVAPPGTAGVAVTPTTLTGFPAGVTSGAYSNVFDTTLASTYTAAFVTNFAGGVLANAEAAFINGLLAGQAYFNIHSSTFPAGEIRGFLQTTPVPGALPLFATGLGTLGLYGWRRKRKLRAA